MTTRGREAGPTRLYFFNITIQNFPNRLIYSIFEYVEEDEEDENFKGQYER